MKQVDKEEQLIRNLMKHSEVEMPFSDFEERMMDKIFEEKIQSKAVKSNIRVAWFFFFLGLFFGLMITNMMANLDTIAEGIPMEKIAFFTQIGIALLLLFQLDKLIDFRFNKKSD